MGKRGRYKKQKPVEIFEKYFIKNRTECWNWTGKIHKITGYGNFSANIGDGERKTFLSHRFSYEAYRDKIPEGMTIDHLCRNRRCVNPSHLEVVTLKENILRGNGISAINKRKTHCIRGHILSDKNLYITPDNRRQCKKCGNMRQDKWKINNR